MIFLSLPKTQCHLYLDAIKVRIALAGLDLETEDDDGQQDWNDCQADQENSRLQVPILSHGGIICKHFQHSSSVNNSKFINLITELEL